MLKSFLYAFINILKSFSQLNKKVLATERTGLHKECVSRKHRRCQYILSRNSNDPKLKAFYIQYCTILNKVINKAKRQNYSRVKETPDNKIRTTSNTVRKRTQTVHTTKHISSLLTQNKKLKDPENIQ
jgi:hypothetical protein